VNAAMRASHEFVLYQKKEAGKRKRDAGCKDRNRRFHPASDFCPAWLAACRSNRGQAFGGFSG